MNSCISEDLAEENEGFIDGLLSQIIEYTEQ